MSLIHLIKYALSLNPTYALRQTFKFVSRQIKNKLPFYINLHDSSFYDAKSIKDPTFNRILYDFHLPDNNSTLYDIYTHSQKIFKHQFNILGSGENIVSYGMSCNGFMGHLYLERNQNFDHNNLANNVNLGNQSYSRKIRKLITSDYQPIDWQLDFKSGFRWSELTPSGSILYGHKLGVDIKVPWELARLQHLPLIALCAAPNKRATKQSSAILLKKFKLEFMNQSLDFIASNPPGWGVNWVCTMDVSIRAINLIIAFNIFAENGTKFEKDFLREFTASLMSHGHHIVSNLEWDKDFRGNHYLTNTLGLIFLGAFLRESIETNHWLAFGIQELISETKKQFLGDGANFEASTCYHRLSAEIVTFGTALVLGLPESRKNSLKKIDPQKWRFIPEIQTRFLRSIGSQKFIGQPHFDLIARMALFTIHITKPNRQILQIGDNDSGRIIKIFPTYENDLDHSHLIASINGIFDEKELKKFLGEKGYFETSLIQSLAHNQVAKSTWFTKKLKQTIPKKSHLNITKLIETNIFFSDPEITQNLKIIKFPYFGLYIWYSERFFLSVRCGPIGQNGRGGHAHNDQLSIGLQIDGIDWIMDPGSFIYTPDPKVRNLYRSFFAHACPRIEKDEPSRLSYGMFQLENNTNAKCVQFGKKRFLGTYSGKKNIIYRQIEIHPGAIQLIDGIVGHHHKQAIFEVKNAYSPNDLTEIFDLKCPVSKHYGVCDQTTR